MYYDLFILAVGVERLVELWSPGETRNGQLLTGARSSVAITTRRWSVCMRCCWLRAS